MYFYNFMYIFLSVCDEGGGPKLSLIHICIYACICLHFYTLLFINWNFGPPYTSSLKPKFSVCDCFGLWQPRQTLCDNNENHCSFFVVVNCVIVTPQEWLHINVRSLCRLYVFLCVYICVGWIYQDIPSILVWERWNHRVYIYDKVRHTTPSSPPLWFSRLEGDL